MSATTMNPETADGQIARLLAANDELKAELNKARVLAENLEEDRDKLERQRDAIKGSNDLMRTRLAMLHVGIVDTLDRLSNRMQSLVTQEQLDATLAEWSATTVKLCRQEIEP